MTTRITLFFLLLAGGLAAQSIEYGGGFQVYFMPGHVLETNQLTNYNGPTTSSHEVFSVLPTLCLATSANIPLFEREGYSFGIHPGYVFSGMIRDGGWLLGGRGDLFINWRTGAHASYANYKEDQRFFGIGVGYSLYSIINSTDTYSDKFLAAKPSMYLETGVDKHKFKLFLQLVPYKSEYPSYTGGIPKITYWQFGMTWEHYFFIGEKD